jgi:hypothetical protein
MTATRGGPRVADGGREENEAMMTRTFFGGLAAIAFMISACGSGEPQEQATPVCSGPPTDPCLLTIGEPGFVRAAAAVTDGVSTATVRHRPGRFCMSGKLDPGATNMNWGSVLVLALTERTLTSIPAPFDAAARDIAQVQFTVDRAPPAGLTVAFGAVQGADCLVLPDCFTEAQFFLIENGGASTIIDDPGTVTASLATFAQPSWGDPALPFDRTLIANVQFGMLPLPGVVLDYDFCVQDVKFLDATGAEVSP